VKVCCVPLELNHPSISHENLYFSRYPTGVKLERAIWPISPLSITHPTSVFPSFIFCVPSPFLSPSPSLHPHGTSCGQRPSGWHESQPTDELTLRPSLPHNAVVAHRFRVVYNQGFLGSGQYLWWPIGEDSMGKLTHGTVGKRGIEA
jgi:hypothetical protein